MSLAELADEDPILVLPEKRRGFCYTTTAVIKANRLISISYTIIMVTVSRLHGADEDIQDVLVCFTPHYFGVPVTIFPLLWQFCMYVVCWPERHAHGAR